MNPLLIFSHSAADLPARSCGNIDSHLLVFRFNFGSMSSSSDGFRQQLPLLLALTATLAHSSTSSTPFTSPSYWPNDNWLKLYGKFRALSLLTAAPISSIFLNFSNRFLHTFAAAT